MSRHSREELQEQQRQKTFLMLLGIQAVAGGLTESGDGQPKAPVTPFLDAKKAQEKFNGNSPKCDHRSSPKSGKSKHNYR